MMLGMIFARRLISYERSRLMSCPFLKEMFEEISLVEAHASYDEIERIYVFLGELLCRARIASAAVVSIEAIRKTHRMAGLIVSADRSDDRVH